METLHPNARRDPYGGKINRSHMPLLAFGVPWISIMVGSLTPWLPVIASAPVLPPFGFLMMLAWRLLRPGLLPLWAGLPLGFFDDLYSGQPIGSGILLFSTTLIVIELVEARFPWRNFWLDWLMAAAIVTTYIVIAAMFSGGVDNFVQLAVIVPMLVISIVLYPIVARLVAMLDRLRLMCVRRVS